MTTPVFVAKVTGSATTAPTISVVDPSTPGCVLIAVWECDGGGQTCTPPDGTWTQFFNGSLATDGATYFSWYKKVSAGTGGTLTFTSPVNLDAALVVSAWSSADGTTPLDVTPADTVVDTGLTSPAAVSAPSITTVTNSCLLVFVGIADMTSNTPNADAFAAPTGYTSRAAFFDASGWNAICVAEKAQTTAGATGTVTGATVTRTGATFGVVGGTIALRPAAGGGGPITDQVPLAGASNLPASRSTAARRYDVIGPIGALLVAALTSLPGDAYSAPNPPRAVGINRPALLATAPIGTGIFALTKFSHSASTPLPPQAPPSRPVLQPAQPVGALIGAGPAAFGWQPVLQTAPLAQRVDRPQPSAPTGPLSPFVSASTGWLRADLPVDSPLIARTVSDSSPVGTLLPATLTSIGWFSVGLARASGQLLRSQDASAPTAPLQPFVSASTGWLRADIPVDLPLISRTVSEISPVGALLPGALTSLGWLGADVLRAPRVTPRIQEAAAPTGPLKPFVSASTGWLRQDIPVDLPLISRVVSESAPTGALMTPALSSFGWFHFDTTSPRPTAAMQIVAVDFSGSTAPAALGGTPWEMGPLPMRATVSARPEASAPVGTLIVQSLTSLGWMRAEIRTPVLPAPRTQETQAPSGPLKPFVSATLGWLSSDLMIDLPLIRRQVSDSSPVGTLLTPQPFSWGVGYDQGRPAPIVSRRVEPSAPVGTAFAIALPSNGWLATDKPRTPFVSQKSVPVDPVGSLLVLPPLPNLTWLATDNPRTPYASTRAVVVDPVGSSIPLPGQHGPFWFIDQGRPARVRAPAVDSSAPIGTLFATLTSLGWLSPFQAPQSPFSAQRPQPTDPLRALQFGGAPWSTVDVQPGRAAVARAPDASLPVGSLLATGLSGIGWQWTDQLRQPPFVAPRAQEQAAPTGPLAPFVSLSSGWQTAEQPRTRIAATPRAQAIQSHLHYPLAFGGAPWANINTAPIRTPSARGRESIAPIGTAFSQQSSSLGWFTADAPAPRLVFPRVSSVEPIGLFMPPPVLPGMGWNYVMELPPLWHFVARPVPSEPVGSSFALGFRAAPLRRCSPVFDMVGIGRLSPIFDATGIGRLSPIFDETK